MDCESVPMFSTELSFWAVSAACDDGRLALFETAQVRQALVQSPQHLVSQAAGRFLAVAGDEGDGIALVDEVHRCLYL